MKAQQFRLDGKYWLAVENMQVNVKGNLVLVFGSRHELANDRWFKLLSQKYPNAFILSASTAGELFINESLDNSLTATAIEFEHTPLAGHDVNIKDFNNGVEAGMALAKKIKTEDLSFLLLICDGHIVNSEDVLNGLYKSIPESVKIAGGLAADGSSFESTVVGLNNLPAEGNIAVLAFYGNHMNAGASFSSGWEPFGKARTVTRSNGNKLFEIDNIPALQLYKQYLGPLSSKLPASAMLFPLWNWSKSDSASSIRSILSIDENEQSMTFSGNIPVGSFVRLMKCNLSKLINSASYVAQQVLAQNKEGLPTLSIIISCAGRKMPLAQRAVEEIAGVRKIFGSKSIITGFYSYGQISAVPGSLRSELHNQSITILTFDEVEKPLDKSSEILNGNKVLSQDKESIAIAEAEFKKTEPGIIEKINLEESTEDGKNVNVEINTPVITLPVTIMKNGVKEHINQIENGQDNNENSQMSLFEKKGTPLSQVSEAAKTIFSNGSKNGHNNGAKGHSNEYTNGHSIKSNSQPKGEKVDLEYLKEITDGDEALLNETIRMFIDFTPGILENMWISLKSKDWKELSKTAHKFLSSLNFIGNIECKRLVKYLEVSAGKGENTDEFFFILEKVNTMCDEAITYLKGYLPTKLKVLVAEDDPLLLNPLEFRLRKAGYEVISATDGKEAIQKIETSLPDIVISDIMMPSASGMEILYFVKNKIEKRIPVIIVSRVGIEKTIIDSFQLGADDFMTKPFSTNELLSRIKRLITPDFATINKAI